MRYVLHPGWVQSANDKDEHFIGRVQLARLYGVSLDHCGFGDALSYKEMTGDIHLFPREDGNYEKV